ncbi:MAG: dihydrolipoyl dehydrogenase [Desulfovibrionaceae bacterium]|nr:dihydrolipoyl dehydrogenase [Desulfovibrionaceae bacterium]
MVMGDMDMNTDLLVIGGGPGGYGAAFRAADLGLDVIMVDPNPRPGGVCLHKGCIPSKTFLHLAELILDAGKANKMGISFSEPKLDITAMRAWKEQVVDSMADGLVTLAKHRGILLVQGMARFESSDTVRLTGADISHIRFKHGIIATGSRPLELPGISFSPASRIMDSATALTLPDIPKSLLVVGGGYVGLELGSVYAALGSQVTLMEREDRLLAQVDADLVQPLQKRLSKLFAEILFGVRMNSMKENNEGVDVEFQHEQKLEQRRFDRALVAIGRIPNSNDLGLEHTKVTLDSRNFIEINDRQQTSSEHIFAVGDVAGGVMLAHKAIREGRVAAEVICGMKSGFDARAIPAVVYTDPQISWCGLTEQQARAENIPFTVQKFPWKYSGRAQTMGMTNGFTKLLTDQQSGRILGVGITGRNAEGLISEAALAIEMGALAEDIALTIHPHPTLAETEAEAAEIFQGSPTHMMP